MSYPVFHVPAGDVLPVMFNTYAGSTGASVTLTGLAATDIEIYKDGSTTQRASDAGYTLLDTDGIDFDAITGIHGFSIDTGDNTDAGFYTVGAWFTVVVSAVTVDAQTVNFIACQFRLMAAESVAAKPKVDVDAWLGTAAATPTVNGVPEVDVTHWIGTACATPTVAGVPEVDVTHVAGSTTNVAALATNVDAILTDTAVIGAAGAGLTAVALSAAGIDAIWDEATSGHVTAGTYGVAVSDILTDTSTTLQAELDGIQADTEDLQTRIPAALVSGRIDASVGAMAANVLTATAINADAITAAKVAADVHQETIELAFTYDATATYATATAGALVKEIADNAGGSALTAAAIADAVWDEAQADHVAAGSFGVTASEIADILVDTAEIGAAGAGLTAINLPDQTMNITGDITGNLSGSVGSVTGAVGSVTGAVGSVTGLTASDVAAIKAKTDSLTFTQAGHVDSNVQRVNDVAITGDGGATPFNVV